MRRHFRICFDSVYFVSFSPQFYRSIKKNSRFADNTRKLWQHSRCNQMDREFAMHKNSNGRCWIGGRAAAHIRRWWHNKWRSIVYMSAGPCIIRWTWAVSNRPTIPRCQNARTKFLRMWTKGDGKLWPRWMSDHWRRYTTFKYVSQWANNVFAVGNFNTCPILFILQNLWNYKSLKMCLANSKAFKGTTIHVI